MIQSARIKLAGFALCLSLPLLVPLSVAVGSVWLPPVIVFGVVPIVGLWAGEDDSLPMIGLRRSPVLIGYLHCLPRLYAFVWAGTVAWAIAYAASAGLGALQIAGLIVSVGISSAVAICTAHELLHRRSRVDLGLARVMTSLCLYGHMLVEHLHHHARIGTAEYGATAPRGMSGYRFVVSDLMRALRSGWRVERVRLARCKLPWWHNKVLQDYALAAVATVGVALVAGSSGLVMFIGQAMFAVFAFEIITYVHHYGLVREDEEEVGAHHAWAHHCWITNCVTFNNTFHSDHHLRPRTPYYELHAMYGAPRLPASHFVMFFVALMPPLWYSLMHPRLDALEASRNANGETVPDWLLEQRCR